MEINYNNKGNLGCALPELLEKFYTAAALKEFAVLFLNPVSQNSRAWTSRARRTWRRRSSRWRRIL